MMDGRWVNVYGEGKALHYVFYKVEEDKDENLQTLNWNKIPKLKFLCSQSTEKTDRGSVSIGCLIENYPQILHFLTPWSTENNIFYEENYVFPFSFWNFYGTLLLRSVDYLWFHIDL